MRVVTSGLRIADRGKKRTAVRDVYIRVPSCALKTESQGRVSRSPFPVSRSLQLSTATSESCATLWVEVTNPSFSQICRSV